MNKNDQIFEIIDGFKNLTSKIKDDNEKIKYNLKNKDITIEKCKKEYRRLYSEYEELKKKCEELKKKIYENENENQKLIGRNRLQYNNFRKRKPTVKKQKTKKRILLDYDNDEIDNRYEETDNDDDDNDDGDNDENDNDDENNDDDDDNDNDYEIVKVKRNKKKTNKKNNNNNKKKKVPKGIIDYINSRNN